MSRGPGQIEQRILDLLSITKDDDLTVGDLCTRAFQLRRGAIPSRAQRLSATRAAHRIINRLAEARQNRDAALDQVIAEAAVKLGRPPSGRKDFYFPFGIGRYRAIDRQFAAAMRICPGWPQWAAACD